MAISNVFWNLVFLLDLGGAIGLVLAALDRCPGLAARLELLLYGAACLVVPVLVLLFCLARRRERASWRSPETGIVYRDWREG